MCRAVLETSDQDELTKALVAASPGDCIALGAGSYGDVALPEGVSLLGRSAGEVVIKSLSLADRTVARGLAVEDGGVQVEPGASARLDAVLVQDSGTDGIVARRGSSLSVSRSTVLRAAVHGLYLEASAHVTITESVVSDGGGPGIWATCREMCCHASEERPALTLRDTLVRKNRIVGVALYGADAVLEHVSIVQTMPGDAIHFGEGGGGLSAIACSAVSAKDVRLDDNRYYGVLVDGSTAVLGDVEPQGGVEIKGNLIGAWFQRIPEGPGALFQHGSLVGNAGVGVGVAGGARSVALRHVDVRDTSMQAFPATKDGQIGAMRRIGDGIVWLGGSSVILDDVTSSGNARAGILIDGPVGARGEESVLRGVRSGGNGAVEIVQQGLPPSGARPVVIDSPYLASADHLLDVPVGPPLLGPDL